MINVEQRNRENIYWTRYIFNLQKDIILNKWIVKLRAPSDIIRIDN